LAGGDVGFDPAEKHSADTAPRLRTMNLGNLLGLQAADCGQCPSEWQKSTYPAPYQAKLRVVHEGIDTDLAVPDDRARLRVAGSDLELAAGDEVLTYAARNLEPYRGFPSFMRSPPEVLAARPQAQVLVVGGDAVSYGARLPQGQSYRQTLLGELGDSLDLRRVHFLGKLPHPVFLKVLQLSRAHVYLTYLFVLSWSMLEAMAAGCLIIASRTAPVEEVVRDGENGLLVDFFNPQEIAARVIAALAEPRRFADLRVGARKHIVNVLDLKRICLPAQLRLIEALTGGIAPPPD
jgi:glycosyltransferase involved in cell wall biosynthesis